MFHPFVDLEQLKTKNADDLQKTIGDLYKKLTYAQRTQNSALSHQIMMVIESYNHIYRTKMDELMANKNLNAQIQIDKKS